MDDIDWFNKKKRRPYWTKSLLKQMTSGLDKELKNEVHEIYEKYVMKPKKIIRDRLNNDKI